MTGGRDQQSSNVPSRKGSLGGEEHHMRQGNQANATHSRDEKIEQDPYVLPAWLDIRPRTKDFQREQAVWVAPGVEIWGDVRLAEEVSVWFGSVLRGDVHYVAVGKRSNIQDGTIIHVTNRNPCVIGENVTVGHRALLHGCTVEDLVLIGMGAIVLTGAVIGLGAVIAAGAVVKENTVVPPFTLMAGVPARPIRVLNEEATRLDHLGWAEKYVRLSQTYAKETQR